MGISVEFNPDLALRNYSEYEKGKRQRRMYSLDLKKGAVYDFLKKDQRNYWFDEEIPLLETKGDEQLSRPKASIQILEAIHFVKDGSVWTKGKYKLIDVFGNDQTIYFESYARIK